MLAFPLLDQLPTFYGFFLRIIGFVSQALDLGGLNLLDLLLFELLFSLYAPLVFIDSLAAEVLLHLVKELASLMLLPVFAADVAELVAAPAGHVVASIGFLDPISAGRTLFAI